MDVGTVESLHGLREKLKSEKIEPWSSIVSSGWGRLRLT